MEERKRENWNTYDDDDDDDVDDDECDDGDDDDDDGDAEKGWEQKWGGGKWSCPFKR